MYDELKSNIDESYRKFDQRKLSAKTSKSIEIQTEMHPIPYNKQINYTYSIWDLRRRAIQLANIRASQTRSTQTIVSSLRVDTNQQTFPLVDKENQSRRHANV